MTQQFDLVIRNGLVIDGTGGEPIEADVAVSGSRIAAVGKVAGAGREEIDAAGKIVTPGFIDLHTHLDGHVTWESKLYPATGHGVTTAVIGNCGVGFAPCHKGDHETLIRLMEWVEDIGFDDLSAGLPWDWETFPDYLDALSRRRFNMDVGALLPHSTLRAYVMGERSLEEGAATGDDLERIAALTRASSAAGALGFGTSTLVDQRTMDGRHIPSFNADEAEFTAIAKALGEGGGGVFQVAIEFNRFPLACEELEMFARVGAASGQPITFSCKQTNGTPEGWRDLLAISDRANAAGVTMHPQVLGRPTGAIMGLQTTMNPFSRCPSYAPLAKLSVPEKVRAMRDPDLRARLIAEGEEAQRKMVERARGYRFVFPLNDPPNYEPTEDESVEAMASRRGIPAAELAYDLLLEKDGYQLLLLAGGNYAQFSLDPAMEMLRNPHSLPGLGDAGAHAGIICDASTSTYLLSYWTRDRTRGERLPLPQVVKWLSADSAGALGLSDRGTIAPGMKADLNVIDHDRIALRPPRATNDLPAGGTRLVQDAVGYVATVVGGEIVHRDDRPTEALPGRLVRRGAA
jgi:N-acyl-D-aspartate/D-glutamate deacylase